MIGKHRTTIQEDDHYLIVTYVSTPVFKWAKSRGLIVLDSGGWTTATTKKRMNQCLDHIGVNARVYQKNHDWYIDINGTTIDFFDGVCFMPAEFGGEAE